METNLIDILTLVVAAIALILSILGHRRTRTIDNENQLYFAKISAYQVITSEIAKFTQIAEGVTEQLKGATMISQNERDSFIEVTAGNLFTGLRTFRTAVAGHLFLIPEHINNKIELFYCSYMKDKPELPDWKDPYKELDTSIDNLYNRANAVYDAIREDLNLEALHTKLLKRTATYS